MQIIFQGSELVSGSARILRLEVEEQFTFARGPSIPDVLVFNTQSTILPIVET